MPLYRIALADDHTLLRKGISRIISEWGDCEIVGEAADGLELLRVLKSSPADMVILDLSMPFVRGIDIIADIKAILPQVRVLMLTMHKDMDVVCRAISSGIHGYILKDEAEEELLSAVKKIRKGQIYLSPGLHEDINLNWLNMQKGTATRQSGDDLTSREWQIVKLIAEGNASREIGALLSISAHTVDRHRANIMNKLKIRKMTDLVKFAVKKGLV
jgi:DNA-binding NarL/FixJ family response regulator